jgi:DinB superfamily/Pentapeptide repeats (8 copies)
MPETFHERDLSGARFERVELSGAVFEHVRLAGARFQGVDLSGVRISDADVRDVELNGDIDGLRIHGIDVGPLIEAELDRLYPERPKLRPTDVAGYREAWALIEQLWAGTVERARRLDPALLHEHVDGEWSFIETLRHLVFATDAWVIRGLLGNPAPWDPLDLPWDSAPPMEGVPHDRDVRPSLDEVLALRADRMATVRQVLSELTDERLAGSTEPVPGPGWPPPEESFPVREALRVVINEEWWHRRYAERDLDVLEVGPVPDQS